MAQWRTSSTQRHTVQATGVPLWANDEEGMDYIICKQCRWFNWNVLPIDHFWLGCINYLAVEYVNCQCPQLWARFWLAIWCFLEFFFRINSHAWTNQLTNLQTWARFRTRRRRESAATGSIYVCAGICLATQLLEGENETNLQTWARFRTRRRRERCNTRIRLRCHLPRPLESESGTNQLTFRLGCGFALDAERELQHRDPSALASGYPASRGWKRNRPTN